MEVRLRAERGRPRTTSSSRVLLAWAVATSLVPLGPSAAAQELTRHSIPRPPAVNGLVEDWWMGGTAIPTTRSLVLNAGVPKRVGLLWNKAPLLTNDFEVTMVLSVAGKDQPPPEGDRGGGIALWYVYEDEARALENISATLLHDQDQIVDNTWMKGFEDLGYDLLGHKGKYHGVGAFLCERDAAGAVAPTASLKANLGSETVHLHAGVPTASPVKFDFRTGQEFTAKLRVQPHMATLTIEGHGSVEEKLESRPNGYIGLTSMGGTSFVQLHSLKVENLDKSQAGEEHHPTTLPPVVAQEDKIDVLADSSSFKEHREASDAIKDLTNMVFKFVVETEPVQMHMERAVESIGKRIAILEESFAELKDAVDKKSGHKLAVDFDSIKQELSSLGSVVTSGDSEQRRQKLSNLHADIHQIHKTGASPGVIDKHLDKLSESNDKVIEQLSGEHQMMFGVSIAAIAFIVIAGLSLYNKFRSWEKKHVL